MNAIHFNAALKIAAKYYSDATASADDTAIYVIRDLLGRITFAVDSEEANYPEKAKLILEGAADALGAFASAKVVLFRDEVYNFDAFFREGQWHEAIVQYPTDGQKLITVSVPLMDRQITGQDWLSVSNAEKAQHPTRVVFYSLKGGVGRSTALVMLALHLAKQGKRVLLLDFDLESPGLSSLLLQSENAASFGIVDWFVEDAVSQGTDVLRDMLTTSPLSDAVEGVIRVASAAGLDEEDYLAKLSRTYADLPSTEGVKRFAARMIQFVEALEEQERPDVVLIDSRAGLHDLAAVSIVSLADVALLFSANSQQNWDGYRHLFKHWQRIPDIARQVRDRLQIVYGLFPETDQEDRVKSFLRNSWDLFRDTLYDEIPAESSPGAIDAAPDGSDRFSFDESDVAAPHFPWIVRWNQRFLEFDPLLPEEIGGLNARDIENAYGSFLFNLDQWLIERKNGAH